MAVYSAALDALPFLFRASASLSKRVQTLECGIVIPFQMYHINESSFSLQEEVQVRMVPKSEAVLSSPEAPTPNSPEQSDMGLQSTSTNSAKTGSTIPAASSWGFLDRLAASIGRGANTESVPTSPVGAGGSPDEKEKLLVSGERNETDVNKGAGEHTADSEPAVSTAPESANALHGSRDEAHSDTETFEDAPHMFASGADSEPGALDTATASPTVRKPETPGAVSSDGKVPVRTVVKKRSERLRVVLVSRTAGTGPATEGLGVLNKIVEEGELPGVEHLALTEGLLGFWAQKEPETWRSLRTLNLSGCNLSVRVLLHLLSISYFLLLCAWKPQVYKAQKGFETWRSLSMLNLCRCSLLMQMLMPPRSRFLSRLAIRIAPLKHCFVHICPRVCNCQC